MQQIPRKKNLLTPDIIGHVYTQTLSPPSSFSSVSSPSPKTHDNDSFTWQIIPLDS